MQRFLFLLGLLVMLDACQLAPKPEEQLQAYFDLDSLLDAQVQLLANQGAKLHKTVVMDGTTEQQTESPDTAGWKEEFIIIRDFNLNKSYYVGAYTTKALDHGYRYELVANNKAPVLVFEVLKTDGDITSITATYFEDKTIYQHKRKLRLDFDGSALKGYSITGFQKMVMKDTVNYSISGEVD